MIKLFAIFAGFLILGLLVCLFGEFFCLWGWWCVVYGWWLGYPLQSAITACTDSIIGKFNFIYLHSVISASII